MKIKEWLRTEDNDVDIVEIFTIIDDIRDTHSPRARSPHIKLFEDGSGVFEAVNFTCKDKYEFVAGDFIDIFTSIRDGESDIVEAGKNVKALMSKINSVDRESSEIFSFRNLKEFLVKAEKFYEEINHIETEEFDIDEAGYFDYD